MKIVELFPSCQSQIPSSDSLQNRRLSSVVGPSQNDVSWQSKSDFLESLKSSDGDAFNHDALFRLLITSSSLPRSSITLTAICPCSPASNGALVVPDK